jgi:type VI secretion system protein ImpJ
MRRLQPVVWTKGTVLTPQHLQAQDRFIESSLQFRLEALSFKPWGFSSLTLDQEALAAGQFAVAHASGMFQDGLTFDIPGSDPAPPARPLEAFFENPGQELELYLAIPSHKERGINVAASRHDADTRFLAETAIVRDETTIQSEKPVQVARKNFRILAAPEVREGMPALQAATVVRNEAGMYQVAPVFIPPLLDLAASDALLAIARRLVEVLSAKSSALSGMRRQKSKSLADFSSSDIANFWLLYTINTHLPLVRHLYETRHGHPEGLFSFMLSLAGALTTFSFQVRPQDLPTYEHAELGRCFRDLDEKLLLLLETVVPSNYAALPLKLAAPSIYAVSLDDDKYLLNTKMYLAIHSALNEAELIARVPQLVKVCSANHIDHLVKHALPGVQLTHVPVPPSAIPVKLNYQYFALNQSGPAWEAVGRSRNFAAYVPGDFPEPALELIIVLPQAG